jgi:hypothetical protein
VKTHAVIFSKNRTLQLKSLLLSLRFHTDLPEENISVIYVESGEISYEPLKSSFRCAFVKQGTFLEDLRNIVSNSGSNYIQFMVDDLIFRAPHSAKETEEFLDHRQDVEAFSPRMGLNITKGGGHPSFERDGKFLIWDTSPLSGRHWNYFWEVSSSVYRKSLVTEYLAKCRPEKERFPNPFEYHFYSCMPTTRNSGAAGLFNSLRFFFTKKHSRMACAEKSSCFTQGINLVADINDSRKEFFAPLTLHKKMLEGYIISFETPPEGMPDSPNAGERHFKLVRSDV